MKKILFFLIIVMTFIITVIFFLKSNYKNNKIGNNKSIEEIESYILNIKSYKATLNVNVKNTTYENYVELELESSLENKEKLLNNIKIVENCVITGENIYIQEENL